MTKDEAGQPLSESESTELGKLLENGDEPTNPTGDLWAQNKFNLEQNEIVLVGGPADQFAMQLPNGVYHVAVETAFGNITYYRDPKHPFRFTQDKPPV